MESGAFSQDSFAELAKHAVLFCHITTQVASDPDQDLRPRMGGSGFPLLVFLDPQGNVIAHHEGRREPRSFLQTLDREVSPYMALAAAARSGIEGAAGKLLLRRIELEHFTPEVAREQLRQQRDPSWTAEQLTRIEQGITNQEFRAGLASMHGGEDALAKVGTQFAVMFAAQRIPQGGDAHLFWLILGKDALARKDQTLLESVLAETRRRGADHAATRNVTEQLTRLREQK